MYAQLIAYEKGTKNVLDLVESDKARTLATNFYVSNEEGHEKTDFVINFHQAGGEKVGSKEVSFGIPKRCKKPRPVVTVDDSLYDLEKYIKEIFKGNREPEMAPENKGNIEVKGRNVPSAVPGAVPGETWEQTRRRQERNRRKAKRRALRNKGKRAA